MEKSKYFIECGKFFDGKNEVLKDNIKILTEGEFIVNVGENIKCPNDATKIDLSDLTVTPGLIDAHVHFDFIGPHAFSTYNLTDSDEKKTLNILYCAQKSLNSGFTTVRVIGTGINNYGAIDIKRAIDNKMFTASRLIVAPHYIGATGGHVDSSAVVSTNPALSDAMEKLNPAIGNGVEFIKQAVRKEVKYGADFIKIIATGGFASPNDSPDDKQLDDDELRAVITTAKGLGKSVTAHAYTSELIDTLVDMGIDGIEHGSLMNEKTADLMEKNGVYLVATFMPYQEAVHFDEEKLKTKDACFVRKLEKFQDQLIETRKTVVNRILNSNITIGYGTDMVSVYDNFDCWREFKAWREEGIPALKTLKAATSVNAKIIGRTDIGSIEPGQIADIAAWNRDILKDTEAISTCDFVMKEGQLVKCH